MDTVQDIIRHVFAFDGDVYGECVRDIWVLRCTPGKITVRMDPVYHTPFMNVLTLKYQVQEKSESTNSYMKWYDVDGMHLSVMPMKRFDFRAMPCTFECNMLAMNATSLYVWKSFPGIRHIIDKLYWVSKRILNKEFCLTHKCYTGSSPWCAVEEAVGMVAQGWAMDAALLGEESWLVNRWGAMPNDRRMKCTECAICQEQYKADDIVVNTCCNHNFHWVCKNERLGLKKWVAGEKQDTCPACRALMF